MNTFPRTLPPTHVQEVFPNPFPFYNSSCYKQSYRGSAVSLGIKDIYVVQVSFF